MQKFTLALTDLCGTRTLNLCFYPFKQGIDRCRCSGFDGYKGQLTTLPCILQTAFTTGHRKTFTAATKQAANDRPLLLETLRRKQLKFKPQDTDNHYDYRQRVDLTSSIS